MTCNTQSLLIKIFTLVLVLSTCFLYGAPNSITGKVVSVADGDTITVLTSDKVQHKIRFAHIDTPEMNQPYGKKAKQHLSSLIFNKTVKVDITTKDRYGRSIGVVWLSEREINLTMVEAGLAWHYKRYSKDEAYSQVELNAKTAKIGLWADDKAVPPWEFRKNKKENK